MGQNVCEFMKLLFVGPVNCSPHIAIACNVCNVKCRLRNLQAQALSNATPPVGKIEPLQQNF